MSSEEKPSRKVIPYARQSIDESDIAAVGEALRSDFVTQGPRVSYLEDALREIAGARYAVAVSSGTAALHLSCQGLGLGPGDCGVVPGITFTATANCLRYCGAEPVFADVDPLTGLAGPESIRTALEGCGDPGRVRAIIPVSFTGRVPDLEAIQEIANANRSFVIEDAAHSLGGSYRSADGVERRSASCCHGDAAILSFHPVKHICSGEGGAVLTNDATLARRLRRLRSHGIERLEGEEGWLYDQIELGSHYRMTEMQAALGLSQLGKLPRFLARRRALAQRYLEVFRSDPALSVLRPACPSEPSAWHLFVVHFRDEAERRAAYRFLHSQGIRVQVHYIPVYRLSYYREAGHGALEGAESFYRTCLSLPLYPDLKDEEQDYVLDCLRAFLGATAR